MYSIRRDYYLVLPANVHFNRKFTLQYCKTILFKYLDKDLAFFVFKRLKISFSPTITLKQIIKYTKPIIQKINLTKPFQPSNIQCSCKSYQDLCSKNSEHICIKLHEINNKHTNLKFLLSLNSKTPTLSDTTIHHSTSKNVFNKFFQQFNIYLNTNELNRLSSYNKQQEDKRSHPIPTDFIKNVMSQYPNLVFSNLDKNENSWVIICPMLYTKMYHSHFNFNSNVYTLPNLSKNQFITFLKNKALFYMFLLLLT